MNDPFGYRNDREEYQQAAPRRVSGYQDSYAKASLVMGILSLTLTCCCCCMIPVNLILGILAVVFAFIHRSRNDGQMCAKARWGLALGVIGILLFVLIIVLLFGPTPVPSGFESTEEMKQWFEQVQNYYENPEAYPNGIPMPEGFE